MIKHEEIQKLNKKVDELQERFKKIEANVYSKDMQPLVLVKNEKILIQEILKICGRLKENNKKVKVLKPLINNPETSCKNVTNKKKHAPNTVKINLKNEKLRNKELQKLKEDFDEISLSKEKNNCTK